MEKRQSADHDSTFFLQAQLQRHLFGKHRLSFHISLSYLMDGKSRGTFNCEDDKAIIYSLYAAVNDVMNKAD